MLLYILYGIFILTCIVLVMVVLLQPGKADAGALFTSSVSSTAFGPRGTQTILAKITIVAAILFMLLALVLSMGIGTPRSLMEGGGAASPTPQATPATNATPGTSASPAATQQEGGQVNAPAGTASPAANPVASPAGSPAASPAPASSPQAQATPANR